jgi:hypothetical protein
MIIIFKNAYRNSLTRYMDVVKGSRNLKALFIFQFHTSNFKDGLANSYSIGFYFYFENTFSLLFFPFIYHPFVYHYIVKVLILVVQIRISHDFPLSLTTPHSYHLTGNHKSLGCSFKYRNKNK